MSLDVWAMQLAAHRALLIRVGPASGIQVEQAVAKHIEESSPQAVLALCAELSMAKAALKIEAQHQPRICPHCLTDNTVTPLAKHVDCPLSVLVGRDD